MQMTQSHHLAPNISRMKKKVCSKQTTGASHQNHCVPSGRVTRLSERDGPSDRDALLDRFLQDVSIDIVQFRYLFDQVYRLPPAEVIPITEMAVNGANQAKIVGSVECPAVPTVILLAAYGREPKKIGTLIEHRRDVFPLMRLDCDSPSFPERSHGEHLGVQAPWIGSNEDVRCIVRFTLDKFVND